MGTTHVLYQYSTVCSDLRFNSDDDNNNNNNNNNNNKIPNSKVWNPY
jgi:hypothetical protein